MRPAPAAAWRPSRRLTPPYVTLRHLTSPYVTSRHLTSPHVTSRHLTSPHATSRHLTPPHIAYIAFRRFTSPYCSSPHGAPHRNASQRITSLQSIPPDSRRTAPYRLAPHSFAAAHLAASAARSGRMVPLPVLRTVPGRCTLLQTCCQCLLFTGALSALSILALSSKADPLLIYMQPLPPVIARGLPMTRSLPMTMPLPQTLPRPLASHCCWCPEALRLTLYCELEAALPGSMTCGQDEAWFNVRVGVSMEKFAFGKNCKSAACI